MVVGTKTFSTKPSKSFSTPEISSKRNAGTELGAGSAWPTRWRPADVTVPPNSPAYVAAIADAYARRIVDKGREFIPSVVLYEMVESGGRYSPVANKTLRTLGRFSDGKSSLTQTTPRRTRRTVDRS